MMVPSLPAIRLHLALAPEIPISLATMADLFLSYARADRGTAETLAAALAARDYSVWWDRHITGGSEFSVDIERELAACQVVVVAWSAAAKDSPWVKDEAAVGREDGKLVAIALDAGLPPLGFRQYHAIDFSGWNGTADSAEFNSLVEAIEARIRGEAPVDAVSIPTRQARGSRHKPWVWLLGLLAVMAAGFALYDTLSPTEPGVAQQTAAAQSEGQPVAIEPGATPRVAVADFRARGDAGLSEVAAALSEDIANGLSRFSYLRVASRGADGLAVSDEAAYRLEGSLRRAGSTLRLTVQLFKTANGEQVWGESYDRTFEAGDLLAIQDDLTANVVASVADSYGALIRDLSGPVASKSPDEMTPYEAVLRHLVYRQRLGAEDHQVTLAAMERAAELAPNDANVWSALAALYTEEYKHSYNALPGSLDRALEAARNAVKIEPDNAYANFVLAEVYYFRQDLGAFRASAERSIAQNPYDSDSMAMIGILMGYGGDWARGVELSNRAINLNPNHPGWYRFGIVFNQLRQEEYEAALETAQRINLPMYFADPYVRAVAHAFLGHTREAEQAAQEFLALWGADDLAKFEAVHLDRWFYASPELSRMTLEGLGKAGLEFD